MFNELLLIAGLCGCTLILVRGRIFFRWRALVTERFPPDKALIGYGVNCCQCVGFWVGLLGTAAYRLFAENPPTDLAQIMMIFLAGCAISLFSVLADKYIFS